MTQTVLLGDIAEINMGQSPKSEFYNSSGEGLPFMQGVRTFGRMCPTIDTWCTKPTKTADKGDILFSVRAPVGDLNYAPDYMCIGRGLASLKSRNNKFLFYLLEANKDRLISSQTGSVFGSVNATILKNFKLTVPASIDEQDKIADILGTIDEKIELNRQANETLERMGRALFRYHFIDNPEAERWEEGKLSDIADVLTGKGSVKSQMSENGEVPLYGANGVMGTSEDYLYDEPLIITGRVGTLGKVRAVTGPAWFSDNVLIMKPRPGYFGYVLRVAKAFDYISMNRGSSQPLITQTDLRNRQIKLPDDKTLLLFENQHNDIFDTQQKNAEQIQTLTTLRDTLLPRLISGRVRV